MVDNLAFMYAIEPIFLIKTIKYVGLLDLNYDADLPDPSHHF